MQTLANEIEAILYLKGQALSLENLAEYLGCSTDTVADGIIELMGEYAHRDSALEVVETGGGHYSLQLKESFKSLRDKIIPSEIGTGALRTLAAIALKGPIVQSELVELRGGSAYQHIQELVELGLVRKKRQAGNRSSIVLVTDKFRQTYELSEDLQPYFGGSTLASAEIEEDYEPDAVVVSEIAEDSAVVDAAAENSEPKSLVIAEIAQDSVPESSVITEIAESSEPLSSEVLKTIESSELEKTPAVMAETKEDLDSVMVTDAKKDSEPILAPEPSAVTESDTALSENAEN
jgi:segregation and condensation protein B